MNLKTIKKWVKSKMSIQTFDIDLVKRLTDNNQQLYQEKQRLILDLSYVKGLLKVERDNNVELERKIEDKRIALIFITTILIVSLISNAIQIFN